ncbi:MAG: LLM class flavin-dependent oxidoreductase [Spirochaetaceae bacterium]|nr:LLM class flavin-dependent oxidoreductase [Spirochaetaceae bacterium]
MRLGVFLAPFHPADESPTEQLHRDLELVRHLDALGYDEAWIGEHHSGGYEIIASPELFIAHAGAITSRIRLGTGVVSLPYHNPLMVADRIMQLDHQTRGRVMLGCGPGQLVTDAFMLGIEASEQRRMMLEALDVIVPLLRGEVVTKKTDWFDLREAQIQIPPVQWPSPEIAVASAISPSGARAAGQYGLGLLSLAASGPEGYEQLPKHWQVCEEKAREHGQSVDRANWRCVVPMHIAETREQARRDMEHGTLRLAGYMEALGGVKPPFASSTEKMLEEWTGPGLPVFGKLTLGTPDDAVAVIESLVEKSGGFGTVLLLGHNCASPEATRKSYELIARCVMPALNDLNRNRRRSMAWATRNAATFMPALAGGIQKAIEEHERERADRGGAGTQWVATAPGDESA